MQNQQTPQVLAQPFCAQGDKNTIPNAATGSNLASLQEGFPAITGLPISQGGIPPERQDFNGAMNLNSQFYFAFQNGWLPTFSQDVSNAIGGYPQGAVLWYQTDNGLQILQSTIPNNTNNFITNPSVIGTSWVTVGATQAYVQQAIPNYFYTQITNCLTKIPQDIKLVLNSNGSITLKAGSVVYDGSGNKINITSDLTSSSGYTGILFTNASGTSLFTNKLNAVRSGETEPEESGIWYDTINKVVKFKGASSSSYSGEYSLPIALVSAGSSTTAAYSAIDQVFNGFGFIGSVPFVLPGVACLRTGGRNADGTLTSLASSFTQLIIPSNAEVILRTECYLSGNNNASMVPIGAYAYNEDKNNFINISDGALRNLCFAFSVTRDDTGRILSLTPQNVFRAVDYGDVYKRTTVYSSDGSNATITFPTPIKVKDARYLEVVYTAKGKNYTSVIPSVFAPLGIVVGSLNWGGDQTDRDYDCVMNVTCADGCITAFTSLGRDIYIKRVDVVDYLARS